MYIEVMGACLDGSMMKQHLQYIGDCSLQADTTVVALELACMSILHYLAKKITIGSKKKKVFNST